MEGEELTKTPKSPKKIALFVVLGLLTLFIITKFLSRGSAPTPQVASSPAPVIAAPPDLTPIVETIKSGNQSTISFFEQSGAQQIAAINDLIKTIPTQVTAPQVSSPVPTATTIHSSSSTSQTASISNNYSGSQPFGNEGRGYNPTDYAAKTATWKSDPAAKQAEINRITEVIANRNAAGYDNSAQIAELNKVSRL